MKLKVLKRFHDKETNEIRKPGDIIEVSDERGKEIISNSLKVVELLELGEPDKPQQEPQQEPEKPEEVQLVQNPEGTEAGDKAKVKIKNRR